VSDKAERLHLLIERLRQQAQTQIIIKESGQQAHLMQVALWRAFEPLAEALGYDDYGNFRDSYTSLCSSIRADVTVMPIHKETVRASWISCIANISAVFDAKNFGSTTAEVFGRHFSERNLEVLDSISERFQAVDFRESSSGDLQDALNAVRDTIKAFHRSGKLDVRVAAVLSHYLQQMETVFSHVDDFGDETFWKIYKETFATFLQLHPIISGLDNSDEVKGKLAIVAEKLTLKSVAGISVAANIATIGSFVLPHLGIA
tara:strand:- start:377 stop:1156 length:780 start_codon:yes stop_codon:yes gene_type:complete